ncbi:MAG: hypothetical protein K5924_12455 [Chloroflexi bacterium]|nr:hypothetical protein [Chloroflexota bacterium]
MTLTTASVRARPLVAAAALLAVILVALATYAELGYAWSVWTNDGGRDIRAYLGAAERLRDGGVLYRPGVANDTELYRYAPWFAALWIPLVDLPRDAVTAAWVAVLVVASLASVAPMLRAGAVAVPGAALLLAFQLEGAAYGNVQPLMIAMLVLGAARASGPLWVALAASLKAVPIVLVAVYLGRGEYRRALVTGALTALLVGPMLLFDLSGYSTETGGGQMSLIAFSPIVFLALALAATLGTLRWATTRHGWLLGGFAAAAWLPRFLPYEISFVLVGLADLARGRTGLPASRNVRS